MRCRESIINLVCIYSCYFLQIQCKQEFISALNSYKCRILTFSWNIDFVIYCLFSHSFSSFDVSFYADIKNAIGFWRSHLVFKLQLDGLQNEHYSTEYAHSLFYSLSNCIVFFYSHSNTSSRNTLFLQLKKYERPPKTNCIFHISIKNTTIEKNVRKNTYLDFKFFLINLLLYIILYITIFLEQIRSVSAPTVAVEGNCISMCRY